MNENKQNWNLKSQRVQISVWEENSQAQPSLTCDFIEKIDFPQIGSAYRVMFKDERQLDGNNQLELKANVPYFLKMPDPAEAPQQLRQITARFRQELRHRQMINRVAKRRDEDHVSEQSTFFSIPKLKLGGEISLVERNISNLPVLVYEYIEPDQSGSKLPHRQAESINEWFSFARELAGIVQRIHNQGILHSFIVPRNVRYGTIELPNKQRHPHYYLVGFGYAALCDTPGHQAKAVPTDRHYRAPEFRMIQPKDENGSRAEAEKLTDEIQSLGALWFPSDIFSIGAILFKCATGEDPDLKFDYPTNDHQRVSDLKGYVYEKIKNQSPRGGCVNRGPNLWEANENIVKILDRCLRYDPADRYSCTEELIEALEVSEDPSEAVQSIHASSRDMAGGCSNTSDSGGSYTQNLSAFIKICSPKNSPHSSGGVNCEHPFFKSLLIKQYEDSKHIVELVTRGHVEIFGHRDKLVTALCRLLNTLLPSSIYRTMTLPSYWSDENLGSNGRFLTMNKHIARKGVKVERLFLVSQDFYELSDGEREILSHQSKAMDDIATSGKGDCFSIKVLKLTEAEIASFEQNANLVAHIVSPQARSDDAICLNFISQGFARMEYGKRVIKRQINKVRFWLPFDEVFKGKFDEQKQDFKRRFEIADSLKDFMDGHGQKVTLAEILSGK